MSHSLINSAREQLVPLDEDITMIRIRLTFSSVHQSHTIVTSVRLNSSFQYTLADYLGIALLHTSVSVDSPYDMPEDDA